MPREGIDLHTFTVNEYRHALYGCIRPLVHIIAVDIESARVESVHEKDHDTATRAITG